MTATFNFLNMRNIQAVQEDIAFQINMNNTAVDIEVCFTFGEGGDGGGIRLFAWLIKPTLAKFPICIKVACQVQKLSECFTFSAQSLILSACSPSSQCHQTWFSNCDLENTAMPCVFLRTVGHAFLGWCTFSSCWVLPGMSSYIFILVEAHQRTCSMVLAASCTLQRLVHWANYPCDVRRMISLLLIFFIGKLTGNPNVFKWHRTFLRPVLVYGLLIKPVKI